MLLDTEPDDKDELTEAQEDNLLRTRAQQNRHNDEPVTFQVAYERAINDGWFIITIERRFRILLPPPLTRKKRKNYLMQTNESWLKNLFFSCLTNSERGGESRIDRGAPPPATRMEGLPSVTTGRKEYLDNGDMVIVVNKFYEFYHVIGRTK